MRKVAAEQTRQLLLQQGFVLSMSRAGTPTNGNHLDTIAGTDKNVDALPKTASGGSTNLWGCAAPSGATVEERPPSGTTTQVSPCFTFQTLADELNSPGISWKYYAPTSRGGLPLQYLRRHQADTHHGQGDQRKSTPS